MDMVNPYRLWEAMVYTNVAGGDKHFVKCYDCILYIHYANAYNIVLASLSVDSVANVAVTTDGRLASDANSRHDCDNLGDDIWNNLCVKGVHVVVVKNVDLWNDNDFDTRYSMTVGSEKTVTVWAE